MAALSSAPGSPPPSLRLREEGAAPFWPANPIAGISVWQGPKCRAGRSPA